MSESTLNLLDVRPVRRRHVRAVVRAAIDRLPEGGSFVLVHDQHTAQVRDAVGRNEKAEWTVLAVRGSDRYVRITRHRTRKP